MEQVLVAYGAGIATSAAVSSAIEKMAKEHNIKVDIKQIRITEAEPYEDTANLLVTTAVTEEEYKFPVINTYNLLTGIGIEETK